MAKKLFHFTNRILLTLVMVSLPALHFFTGSVWAGNLASFVLSLTLVLVILIILMAADDSRKATKGELKGDKLDKYLKTFPAHDETDKMLFTLSRTAWVIGMFVIAACGYEWFAGFILVAWLFLCAVLSVARDSAEIVRNRMQEA